MDTDALSEMTPEECLSKLQASGMLDNQPDALAQIQKLVAQGVHPMKVIRFGSGTPEDKPRPAMLDSFDIEGIARYIAEKGCQRIVIMCGAGISTSAGIPDFRTPGTGLYDNLKKYDLPRPESIFELKYFRDRPGAFYELAKEMWPGNFEPTPAHYFIRLLEAKGILLRCYSQNIDSLEVQAGVPRQRLIAAHGNFDAAHVIDTDPEVKVPIEELKAAIDQGEAGWQALREKKGNLVKPTIVFFGEGLPERFFELHSQDLKQCDLLIVMGTSLVVHPFASLVGLAAAGAPRILLNRDEAGTCDSLDLGFRFHKTEPDQNWRDVWYKGDCDTGARALATALGWGDDLDALIDSKGSASIVRAPWAAESPDAPPSSSGGDENP